MIQKTISAAVLCLALAPLQVSADDNDLSEGVDLLSQGTQLLLRGLMGELEPALKDLEGVLQDLTLYHRPEILPNGDIIIRRRQPETVDVPEDGEIDL